MSVSFTRRDVGYTLISRFEEGLRDFVALRLPFLFSNYQDGFPTGILTKALDRAGEQRPDNLRDLLEYTDFPDLKEIVCYKNAFARYFPPDTINTADFSIHMDRLYELRCKIAHIRNYFTSLDLDSLIDSVRLIALHLESPGEDIRDFLMSLEKDPGSVVAALPATFVTEETSASAVPNNVPTPDYEYEGGFVGRDDDIRAVTKLLDKSLHKVVTISGAGGVGKTALALRTLQKLLERQTSPFDGIVWLSAKETKLSYLGIEDIEPTVKTYEELLDTIAEVMGFDTVSDSLAAKQAHVETIFELHNCILIAIDNLETVTDESVRNFILEPHAKIKILITSRKGLGQVERRYELKQLKEKEAIYLFRQIAKDKGLDGLVRLDDATIKTYVSRISYYPLAIKWVLGQVAIGKDIHHVIESIDERTNDISHFCFEQIYSELSHPAKRIVCALSLFDEPPSPGVLSFVVNVNQEDFEDGVQELILVSLVIPEQYKNEQNEIASRYSLLSLTRGYVRKQLDNESLVKRNLEERLRTVEITVEEAERAQKQYRFALSNMGATTEEEKVAAMLAQTAFQKYQGGRYLEAGEDYRRACKIAPRFASLYRNWAVMESQEGHIVEADTLLEKASKLKPDDPQVWLTWGNIKRKSDKVRDALDKYQKAYALAPDDVVVLNALGQARTRLGEYEKADGLFRAAIEKEGKDASKRHLIINWCSLADNLARWAETLDKDRRRDEAEAKYIEALGYCQRAVDLDVTDTKSLDLLRHILINAGYFYRPSDPDKAVSFFRKAMVPNPQRFREIQDTVVAGIAAAKILFRNGKLQEAKEVYTTKLRRLVSRLRNRPKVQDRAEFFWEELYNVRAFVNGVILRMHPDRGFCVIKKNDGSGETYLGHVKSFYPKLESLKGLEVGMEVWFVPKEMLTEEGLKKQATYIKVAGSEADEND
jgi:tetratricopeptide (TPR) repeat protein